MVVIDTLYAYPKTKKEEHINLYFSNDGSKYHYVRIKNFNAFMNDINKHDFMHDLQLDTLNDGTSRVGYYCVTKTGGCLSEVRGRSDSTVSDKRARS